MSVTPLQKALAWFGERDEMGGFLTVGKELFAGWEPKRCCRAPHREDREASFSVYRNEREEWRFKDFGTDEQGGLVGFVMLAGMEEKQASRWLMEKAGVIVRGSARAFASNGARNRGERKMVVWEPHGICLGGLAAEPETLLGITGEALDEWIEGNHFLAASRDRIDALARFRGWPVEWAERLVGNHAISMPHYHGKRTVAFLVEAPEGERGSMTARKLGYHCRLKPRRGQVKAGWRFVPNATEHGQSTPALPYVIGGSQFESAKLLVITGGQWDALTFAFAAGWLGKGRHWPAGVCVIGIRGDASSNVFLRYNARFWPPAANCLILPDLDLSGMKWFLGPNSFSKRLSARCLQVAAETFSPHKDINDYYRAVRPTLEQIAEMLASHGMAVETEVAI